MTTPIGMAGGIPPLEILALERYLVILEDASAGIVQLARHHSMIGRRILPLMMSSLKDHLSRHLLGTASSVLRDEMIHRVLNSGRFPSTKYHHCYELLSEMDVTFGTEQDVKSVEEIRANGRKCNSVCCTGAFIVETMMCILMNEDVTKLLLDLGQPDSPGRLRFWNKDKIMKKYVCFQVPTVLAHYTDALKTMQEEKTPKLTRLVINNTNIRSRIFATQNHHFDVLTSFDETTQYLEIPGRLSEMVPDGKQYWAFSEHLMMSLGQMFEGRTFYKMTEIILGHEACNMGLRMTGPSQKNVTSDLFRALGQACPRLRVLDLASSINLSAESLLFMVFKDAYRTLHQFVFLPEERRAVNGLIVQNSECELSDISKHDQRPKCGWCYRDSEIEAAKTNGVYQADISTHILDDRVYEAVERKYPEEACLFLMNVVKVSDLVKCVDTNEKRELELNPICQSLQSLKLNIDTVWPKHEIVPFLFTSMPQLKSLGHINVVRGLKMIRDIPPISWIQATNLEEIDFGFGGSQMDKSNTSWCHNDVSDFIETFSDDLFAYRNLSTDDKLTLLRQDVKLLSQQCPRLRRVKVYLFGETPYLHEDDEETWNPLVSLPHLQELQLMAHQWSESISLLKTVGSKLTSLYLSLDGRSSMWNNFGHPWRHIPELDEILVLCPYVRDLTLSFGVKNVEVGAEALHNHAVYPNLVHFNVHTFMTKRAFSYLWPRSPNLEVLKVNRILMNDDEPALNNNPDHGYDELEMIRLFRVNPLSELTKFNVTITLKNIATARLLIESLSHVNDIGMLVIRVGFPQDNYNSQEEMLHGLTQVMQSMRQFKLFCEDKGKQGKRISWRWERFGGLESFSQLQQLNALIEPTP